MKVRNIRLSNFMPFEEVDLYFPETGIVMITGENGEGKSSILEAMPVAHWGKTLRGTPWYQNEKDCLAAVVSDIAKVHRTRSAKGKNGLTWGTGDRDLVTYDTATKGQEALTTLIGSFEVWKRTRVFSSSDNAHLSRATDGDRKRFMETVLGIDRLDTALKKCRDDLKKSKSRLATAEDKYELLDTKQSYEKKRMLDAVASRENNLLAEEPSSQLDRFDADITSVQAEHRSIRDRRRDLERDRSAKEQTWMRATDEKKLLENGNCPTCAQDIPESLQLSLDVRVTKTLEEMGVFHAEADKQLLILDSLIEELSDDLYRLNGEKQAVKNTLKFYKDAVREHARLDKIVEEATAANASFLRQRAETRGVLDVEGTEVALLDACNTVLGLKGIRANLTAGMLKGVETIANRWIRKLSQGKISLTILPYKRKKSGGISDEWSIQVHGAGGGHGYDACSAGQRQRIDIGLMLAAMEVSQAALGQSDGTTWFDEVFDHLDRPGAQAVSEILDELAETRCIVVISHSEILQETLSPDLWFHVDAGKITRHGAGLQSASGN